MEVITEKLLFSREEGGNTCIWRCKLFLINFSKVLLPSCEGDQDLVSCEHDGKELLHAISGVCSVSLPDMEIPAIYNTLTNPSCKTLAIVTSKKNVVSNRELTGCPTPLPPDPPLHPHNIEENAPDEDSNPFADIISDEENDEDEEESLDLFAEDRKTFLEAARKRRCQSDQLNIDSVGAEHCVLGCAAFSRLAGTSKSSDTCKPIQLSLLAVRKSSRKMGLGRYLMQCCKDPEVVGHYDVLLTFADPKAEDFFNRHGFSEDPILSARYQPLVEQWENSTLMIYTPPFSGAGLAVGSLKSLVNFQEFYKQWRESAIVGYSTQLGVMERLRHELLLLHSKVQAQEEVIEAMSKELNQVKEGKALLEQEFQQYRKHSQQLLCEAAVEGAKEWIRTN